MEKKDEIPIEEWAKCASNSYCESYSQINGDYGK